MEQQMASNPGGDQGKGKDGHVHERSSSDDSAAISLKGQLMPYAHCIERFIHNPAVPVLPL